MTMIMGYLPQIEQVWLQGLDTWWYDKGVKRVQWSFVLPEPELYLDNGEGQIIAVSTGRTERCEQYDLRGRSYFEASSKLSCQVG